MNSIVEIWNSIPEYEGYYEISNLGRVRSLDRLVKNRWGSMTSLEGAIIQLAISGNGYVYVGLHIDGKQNNCFVHRLVMTAFKGRSDLFINHKNGIKTDNRPENLEYCTASENVKHAYDTGLNSARGPKNSRSKLTEVDVMEIIDYLDNSDLTQKEIAKKYSIGYKAVSKINLGTNWNYITNRKVTCNEN